jgi:DNA modification methylase
MSAPTTSDCNQDAASAHGSSLQRLVRRQFEGVTLYLGDCLEIIPQLEGIEAVITDPPYGIRVSLGITKKSDGGMWANKTILGDESVQVRDAALAMLEHVKTKAVFASHKMPPPAGLATLVIWDKGNHVGAGNLSMPWSPNFEFVWVAGEWEGKRGSGIIHYNAVGGCIGNRNNGFRYHPTEKPVDVMAHFTTRVKAQTVLDPFMGSGTTAIACIRTGRKFVGIEKDVKYFETACERVANELAQGVLLPPNGKGEPR